MGLRDVWAVAVLVSLTFGLTGCRQGDRPEIGEVTGTVMLDGEPLEGALVAFYPDNGRCVGGATDADGRYELLYLRHVKGAKVGHHQVKITTSSDPSDKGWRPGQSQERVPPWYNVRTTLEANVLPGENVIDFELKTPEGWRAGGEPTSRDTRSMRVILRWFPEADTDGDKVLTKAELDAYRPPPQHVDVPYGEHEKQTIDLYLAPSETPTPLVVYVHGGGFRGGDKGNIWPGLINRCHEAGISVVSLNYRLLPESVFPAPFEDGARAVQFLRHHAKKYNLDPRRLAGTGISAGAGIVLWLALHEDLADPEDVDPIARESTTLSGASVVNAQVSYDPRFYEKHGLTVSGQGLDTLLLSFYGVVQGDEPTPENLDVAGKCAPITHVTDDDPPIYFHYVTAGAAIQNPVLPHNPRGDDLLDDVLPPRSRSDAVHHPEQGRILRRMAEPLGVPVYLTAAPEDSEEIDFVEFLVRAVQGRALPRPTMAVGAELGGRSALRPDSAPVRKPSRGPQPLSSDPLKVLLLDPRVVAEAEGAELRIGRVEKDPRNPLIRADKPWDQYQDTLFPNLVYDPRDGLYKVWYMSILVDDEQIQKMMPPSRIEEAGNVGFYVSYAQSKDGIRWEKPTLGVVGYDGSKETNVVLQDVMNMGVFLDEHASDRARRYKMVHGAARIDGHVRFSPDGVHWTEQIPAPGLEIGDGYVADTHNNAFWDERLGRYVLFTRRITDHGRSVARSTSEDFVHWERPELVLESLPEEGRGRQIYSMPVFRYANGYLGFPTMYNTATDQSTDCELAWSPDSVTWHRILPGTPFIPRGDKLDYDGGFVYAQANHPVLHDGRVRIYYGGGIGIKPKGWKGVCEIALAYLRPDGFAGYAPTEEGGRGVLTTNPLRLVQEAIEISANVGNGGSIRVEVLDERGRVLTRSKAVTESVTDRTLDWESGRGASRQVGRPVVLRIELNDATLFALRGLEVDDEP